MAAARAFAVESLQQTSELLGFNYTMVEYTERWSDASSWNTSGILAEPNNVLWNYKLKTVEEGYPATSGCDQCGFGIRTATIWQDSYTLITTFTTGPSDEWSFLQPLSSGVWLVLAIGAVVFAILLYLVELQAAVRIDSRMTLSVGGFYHSLYHAFSSFTGFWDYSPTTALGKLRVHRSVHRSSRPQAHPATLE